MAGGAFPLIAKNIVKWGMPLAPAEHPSDEPWVFKVVFQADGLPCSVKLRHGPNGVMGEQIAGSIRLWRLTPLMHKGLVQCVQTVVYVYLRSEQGRTVFIIPGLPGPRG